VKGVAAIMEAAATGVETARMATTRMATTRMATTRMATTRMATATVVLGENWPGRQ
jgi:hypothetical protein